MYAISQNTKVWLCKTELEQDNSNQLTFPNKTSQSEYFKSVAVTSFVDFSYQRTGDQYYISVGKNIDELYQCNYVMYQNTQFTNKYFFAFIERLEYKNSKTTYIHIKPDSFQNWQFDIEYNSSFIDRQTQLVDNYDTLQDDIAHGQLVEKMNNIQLLEGAYFAYCTTDVTQDVTYDSPPYSFNIGNYSIPCWVLFWLPTESEQMNKTLQKIANNGWGDRILSVNYVPFVGDLSGIKYTTVKSEKIGDIKIATNIPSANMKKVISLDISSFNTTSFKKGRTFPYSKIVVTDGATGQTIELSPEKFNSSLIEFEIWGTISETPSYRVIPKNYEGQSLALNHALVVKCNTSLPIANNLYAKYLMENKELNSLTKLNSVIGVGMSTIGGGTMGALSGGINAFQTISYVTAKENQASKLGNSLTSILDGAMERLVFNNTIKISLFSLDNDHARMVENFWKMYGYPVRALSTPNIMGNKYNYIKMVNPNIVGRIVPQDEMMNIKSMFENGVTLWHNPNEFLDY